MYNYSSSVCLLCSLAVVTVGFLEAVHRVSESTPQLSVPFMILSPADINQLSLSLFINIQLMDQH